jgi:hypothetical protein
MKTLYVKMQCFTAKFESLHQAFGTPEVSIDKLLRRIGTIKNANQWESFVATLGGINAGNKADASICVQPTAVCRRGDGVTRGSKRLASGRPALSGPNTLNTLSIRSSLNVSDQDSRPYKTGKANCNKTSNH